MHLRIFLLFTICFIFFTKDVFATHNRAGEITYLYIGTNGEYKYQFTITTYTDPNSPADRDALVLYYGDGTFDTVQRTTEESITDDIKKNTYVSEHSYSAPATYIVYMQDPNRVEDIVNIEGSVNVPFYLESKVMIIDPILYGYNSSPILTNDPIDYATIGEIFTHNPGAYDLDGDELKYALKEPRQDPLNPVPGYEFPDEHTDDPSDIFIIDSITGEINWIVPLEEGIYVIAILISEYRDGTLIGCICRDMQIDVQNTPNHAPVIEAIQDTCVFAGDELILFVNASDPDVTQTLTLTASGGPFVVEESPADFFSDPSEGFVSGTFVWQTTCEHIRESFYEVVFKVEDDYQEGPNEYHLTDQESWLITVVAPPVENVTAVAFASEITIAWQDPYICESTDNFLGFSVWRKTDCDTIEFDICQRGLADFGYDSIAFVEDGYTYIDNAVSHGQIYSYRIIAEFGIRSEVAPQFIYNATKSFPSENACAELKRDIPIINHVSVLQTDVSVGEIYIQWYHPLAVDLDTLQNPGPYTYVLKRFEGKIPGSSSVDIASFTYDFFLQISDSVFIDKNLNTETQQYNYVLDFYSNNNLLSSAESASSIFLNATPSDNQILLLWDFQVPWTNYEFNIFKENPTGSGNFDSLTTITEQIFIDDSLANLIEVCYLIKSIGKFTASTLPADTLFNFSQIKCATPIDLEPPCAPFLIVDNICKSDEIVVDPNELRNILLWSNPNTYCADDVVKYYIYYASTNGEPLFILDSILNSEDTSYIHTNLVSLAGCYAIVAVDSFNNQSVLSNVVCIDNCADYNLPNAFSPNNDGYNDLFTPILPYRFIDHIDIKIYNSWGSLIFQTNEAMINWDGKDMQTKNDVNEAVYYYVCVLYKTTVTGVVQDPQPLEGYIHLIRSEK